MELKRELCVRCGLHFLRVTSDGQWPLRIRLGVLSYVRISFRQGFPRRRKVRRDLFFRSMRSILLLRPLGRFDCLLIVSFVVLAQKVHFREDQVRYCSF